MAQAWLAALPPGEASELGNPAITVDPAALDDSEVFNNLGETIDPMSLIALVCEC